MRQNKEYNCENELMKSARGVGKVWLRLYDAFFSVYMCVELKNIVKRKKTAVGFIIVTPNNVFISNR